MGMRNPNQKPNKDNGKNKNKDKGKDKDKEENPAKSCQAEEEAEAEAEAEGKSNQIQGEPNNRCFMFALRKNVFRNMIYGSGSGSGSATPLKVEPQSLQRCRNDQRRPLAQLWPTTPCLSHQKTNFIGKQLKKEEKEQTLDGIWTPGSSGFWRLVRWKDVGNGACSRVGPMRRLISSRSPAWMAAVVLCGRGVEKPRSPVLETRRGCMYLNRVASDSISSATRFPCIRTTCTGATGAPGTLIKTGQSRSLAKDVACIPPSYDRLPELAAAGVRQDYPFLGELAEASKRLLFWTDVSSHQAIIRARVDGNEHVDLEEVRPTVRYPMRIDSTEGRDKTLICDGTTSDNCDNVHDEADCCKRPESFSVPSTSFASAALLCDGRASDIFAHRTKNRALMAPSKKLSN
ncbi:GL22307 [Drosophila persimilis]|uniref:GL22307 n=1 Tax=Drosophila persimilis TaxID=7234 RepID=B4GG08_DROPE|nr:GL22307 [Drosophila persimilis]